MMLEKYHFFYGGPFSQWYPSKFTFKSVNFNCAEQAMMYSKAILFKDFEAVEKILKSTLPEEQKKFGRKVKNYSEEIWNEERYDTVCQLNKAKFDQNKKLREILIGTENKIIVEASPYDKIWGIGLSKENALSINPSNWPGTNLLGKALTQIRNDIINENNI